MKALTSPKKGQIVAVETHLVAKLPEGLAIFNKLSIPYG